MRIFLSLLVFLSLGVTVLGQGASAQPVLAPGVLQVIPPDIDHESVVNRIDMTEVLAVLPPPRPELQSEIRFRPDIWATDIRLVRDVWCLQFSFKPVRIIDVDIPNTLGTFDKKKVWYLVYNVKNLGPARLDEREINSRLTSAVPPGGERALPVPSDETLEGVPRSAPLVVRQQTGVSSPHPGEGEAIRFVPQFVLAASRLVLGTEVNVDPETGETEWKPHTTAVAYADRILPLALLKIKEREKMEGMPETSVSIAQKEIAPGKDYWGVAMWVDVDPRINEFSIFVSGLTNAYRWLDRVTEDGEYENTGNIGEGRIIRRRVLKLDWWRVGDAHSLNESQIHFGSREGTIPVSPFDQTGRRSPEEQKRFEESMQDADVNADEWVSPAEKAIFHLLRQDWLQPAYGYEWVFL